MEVSFSTRLTVAFFVGIFGLIWQGIIVMLGGEASGELIGAFSTIILATIGIGIKDTNGNNNNKTP